MNANESKQAGGCLDRAQTPRLWWSPTPLLVRGVFLHIYSPQPTLPLGAPSGLALPKVSVQTASSTLPSTTESILVFLLHEAPLPLLTAAAFPTPLSKALTQMGVSRATPILG